MAITSLDQVVAALPGIIRPYQKQALAGTFPVGINVSLWMAIGNPGAGVAPTASVVPTNATAGSILFANPGSGNSYLGRAVMAGSVSGYLVIYDRLVHSAGLSGTVATAQTTNLPSAAETRPDALGSGVELWLEWYTATGTTATTVTASYTNQAGTAAQTTASIAVPASVPAAGVLILPLASGDTGVRAVASVTLAATTGTAGNFGVTLARRLCEIPLNIAGNATAMDVFALGMPQIQNSACLAAMFNPVSTAAGVVTGSTNIIQG